MNYLRDINTDISPQEFEQLCLKLLMETEDFTNLNNVLIKHNVKEKADDGEYQLDGYIEYIYLGMKMKVIVECKRYQNSVEREKVMILHRKLHSLGAQKGVLMSTSGFQSGAVEYANKHGLALFQVVDNSILTIQNSMSPINHRISRGKSILMYNLDWDFPAYNLSKDNGEFEKFLKKTQGSDGEED